MSKKKAEEVVTEVKEEVVAPVVEETKEEIIAPVVEKVEAEVVEPEKPSKKAKFKKILKYTGIGLGVAAIGAGISYVAYKFGFDTGAKKVDDGMINKIYDYASTGNFATKIDFVDGSSKYINYVVSDVAPEWWENAIEKDINLADEVLKEV